MNRIETLATSEPLRRPTGKVAAYEALVEARHFCFQFTPAAAERALVCLRRALSIDPDYPAALLMHAFYHVMMGYMLANPLEVLPQIRLLAGRALELDPSNSEAQSAAAIAATWTDWDWPACERDKARQPLDAAGEAGGADYQSPLTRGLVRAVCSEMDTAIEFVQRAVDKREPLLRHLRVRPMFDALRGDPRYPELLRRVNLDCGGQA